MSWARSTLVFTPTSKNSHHSRNQHVVVIASSSYRKYSVRMANLQPAVYTLVPTLDSRIILIVNKNAIQRRGRGKHNHYRLTNTTLHYTPYSCSHVSYDRNSLVWWLMAGCINTSTALVLSVHQFLQAH